nr:MAG TPA: hypothetical protein [Caudoviricetes sp.]
MRGRRAACRRRPRWRRAARRRAVWVRRSGSCEHLRAMARAVRDHEESFQWQKRSLAPLGHDARETGEGDGLGRQTGSSSCAARRSRTCGESGSCNDRFGIADGDSVRANSMLTTYVWPHSGFEHWNVISRKVSDISRLLRAVARVRQCGQRFRMRMRAHSGRKTADGRASRGSRRWPACSPGRSANGCGRTHGSQWMLRARTVGCVRKRRT